eukprot:TRINITY_DN3363_c0_g1_i1.p1 TRINITY_DN3363_c0_g1~~TRINITY_DN3363_c0_g1_i1.p1  ORF type:complete len:446 (-),score=108.62 TRINITY_DN3363_c0_g1_i1:64-1401(-)
MSDLDTTDQPDPSLNETQDNEEAPPADDAAAVVDGVVADVLETLDTKSKPQKQRKLRIYQFEQHERQQRLEEMERERVLRQERRKRFVQTTQTLQRERSPNKAAFASTASTATDSGVEPEHDADLQRAREAEARFAERKRERLERQKKRMAEDERKRELQRAEEEEAAKLRQAQMEQIQKERAEERLRLHERRAREIDERKQKRLELLRLERENASKPKVLLHERLESRYEQVHVIPALEKRKQQLQQLHQQFKPIDFNSLRESEQDTMAKLQAKERELAEKREQLMAKGPAPKYQKGRLGGFATKELRELREQLQRDKEEKLSLMHKRQRYAAMIKEMFPPSVDDIKRKEIEARLTQTGKKMPRRLPHLSNSPSLRSPRASSSDHLHSAAPATDPLSNRRSMSSHNASDLHDIENSVHQHANVSDMYIDAINSKLEYLEHIEAS